MRKKIKKHLRCALGLILSFVILAGGTKIDVCASSLRSASFAALPEAKEKFCANDVSQLTGVGAKKGAAANPYPTTQNMDGDAYYEIPCTRFAWQQVYDNLGIALPAWGNAGTWLDSAQRANIPTGTVAKPGSIAVWSGGAGHVAYVTSASGNTFTVNEGGRTDLDHTSSHGVAYGYTLTNATGASRPYDSAKTLIGFIYPVDNDPCKLHKYIDKPASTEVNMDKGYIDISGWVEDINGVSSVTYSINNSANFDYATLTARQDVSDAYPGYPKGYEGWSVRIEAGQLNFGSNTVKIDLHCNKGLAHEICVITLIKGCACQAFLETTIGGNEVKIENGVCNLEGWVVDLSGISSVTYVINENSAQGTAELYSRKDVESAFEGYPSGDKGWRVAIPVSQFRQGTNTILVEAHCINGISHAIAKVDVEYDATKQTEPPVSTADPQDGEESSAAPEISAPIASDVPDDPATESAVPDSQVTPPVSVVPDDPASPAASGSPVPDGQASPAASGSPAPDDPASGTAAPDASSSAAPKESPEASDSPLIKPTTKPDTSYNSYYTTTYKRTEVSKPAKVKLKSCKSGKKGRITMKWSRASKADGYQIQYSTKRSFAGKKTIRTYGKSCTLRVKSKKNYYVRVRAYRYGNIKFKVYGKWSTVKSVKVK